MNDIDLALAQLAATRPAKELFINYYEGNHPLAFATEKFVNTFGNTLKTLRDNLCPIVVDAPVDRMEIINFSSNSNEQTTTDAAWAVWQQSQMELLASDVHTDAFKCGAGYLIVQPGSDGLAEFHPQNPLNCTVIRDSGNQSMIRFGAKIWTTETNATRLNLYYPEATLKYIAEERQTGGRDLKSEHFALFESETEQGFTANEFGIIPLFEFTTRPVLMDALPIQDALNKTLCDMLVAQEFSAFRQRWATGLEPEQNAITGRPELPFKAGVDRLWFTAGENVNFGEFGATDLEQFLKVQDSFRLEIARVSGTPLHFFALQISSNISGEALKTLESRFTKKIMRAEISFGAIWARAMKLALEINGGMLLADFAVQWASPEQRSDSELLDTLQKKRDTLEIPVDTLREEYGYTVEAIAKFNQSNDALTSTIIGNMIP